MPEFQLDTSGKAYRSISETSMEAIRWADLDAFTQGYVEALFAGGIVDITAEDIRNGTYRFSDLAPETLAAILKDCAAFIAAWPDFTPDHSSGGAFWRVRQLGSDLRVKSFPPLTSYLGDDGKVYLS